MYKLFFYREYFFYTDTLYLKSNIHT